MRVVLDLRERDQVGARRLRLEPNLQEKRGVLEQKVEMSRRFFEISALHVFVRGNWESRQVAVTVAVE